MARWFIIRSAVRWLLSSVINRVRLSTISSVVLLSLFFPRLTRRGRSSSMATTSLTRPRLIRVQLCGVSSAKARTSTFLILPSKMAKILTARGAHTPTRRLTSILSRRMAASTSLRSPMPTATKSANSARLSSRAVAARSRLRPSALR